MANNERRDEGEGNRWSKFVAVAGGSLLAWYGLSKLLDSKEVKSSLQEVATSLAAFTDKFARLVLAVDATPTCGGCVLIDREAKKLHHYRLDWSSYLKFPSQTQEPDKFETVNAFIALQLFSSMINTINGYEEGEETAVTIKVDNSRFSRQRGTPNHPDEDDLFWEKVQELRVGINGEWKYTSKTEDAEFRAADQLSRGKQMDLYREEGYTRENCDMEALETLRSHLRSIPSKYHV